MASAFYYKIYEIIHQIPTGKVATYGQIAILAGRPGAARAVGWALHSSKPETSIPWHRVISASGKSSFPDPLQRKLQQSLLETEGVRFDRNGKTDLNLFQWDGAILPGV